MGADGVTELDEDEGGPNPAAFWARTTNVYATPLVSPVTEAEAVLALAVTPPGLDVTTYAVIALPLLEALFQLTAACAFPADAVTPVGAPGSPKGTTAFEAALFGPLPTAFEAYRLKVYEVPFVRPVTVAVTPVTEKTAEGAAGVGTIVKPVTGRPPLLDGAVQLSVADPSPAVALTFVTALGTSGREIGEDAADGALVPTTFVAVTWNV
jgi:hypothetical protein